MAMDEYQIKAITTFEELEVVRPLWESSATHRCADYEFFRLIVEGRSEVVSPCVLTAFEGDKPVALLLGRIENSKFPIRFGYATVAEIAVRRLLLLDGGFLGLQGEQIQRDLLNSVDQVLVEQRLDLALFEQVRLASPLHGILTQAFKRSRLCAAHAASVHWLMRLPKTWDAFLKGRSKKHRYWLRRLPAVLDRDFPGQWIIQKYTSDSAIEEFMDAAETVASGTYHRQLGVGFHADHEHRQSIKLEARRGQLRGYVLFIKGTPKAFWYCTAFQRTLHLCETGYDPEFRSYELGTVLLMSVFEDHCGSEFELVDFGLGDAGYKQRFGSESFTEASYLLFSKNTRGGGLSALHRITLFGNQLGKGLLDRMQITQRLKTRWKRQLKSTSTTRPNPNHLEEPGRLVSKAAPKVAGPG